MKTLALFVGVEKPEDVERVKSALELVADGLDARMARNEIDASTSWIAGPRELDEADASIAWGMCVGQGEPDTKRVPTEPIDDRALVARHAGRVAWLRYEEARETAIG